MPQYKYVSSVTARLLAGPKSPSQSGTQVGKSARKLPATSNTAAKGAKTSVLSDLRWGLGSSGRRAYHLSEVSREWGNDSKIDEVLHQRKVTSSTARSCEVSRGQNL